MLCVCPGVVPHLASRLPGVEVVWLDRYLAQLAAEVEPVSSLRVAVADATELPPLPGIEWVEYTPEVPKGKFSFTLSPDVVRAWHRRLIDAEAIPGVSHVLCACPGDYLQMMLLRREGAWRLSRVEPVTLAELACRVIRGAQDG
ncbi:MAG: hypothetical protein A2Y63_00710 [Candidatus Riflebacteria bacterium RBG_13_59_9]|nr:MAG: hypothetical protein A2Y63_00710 [Candidatus Riflebacteria bacterium RBG_13_59_9]